MYYLNQIKRHFLPTMQYTHQTHSAVFQNTSPSPPTKNINFLIPHFKLSNLQLRWFKTAFHFPFQLNFMKGLLVCSKRLLLLVDGRCCNNLSTYQLLYSH